MTEINAFTYEDLQTIQKALQIVQEAGFDQVKDVDQLCQVVAQNIVPLEGLESEYMGMSKWTLTPAMWREATLSMNPTAHVKLAGLSEAEMERKLDQLAQDKKDPVMELGNKQPELSEAFEDSSKLRERFKTRLEHPDYGRHFADWYDAMDKARTELICFGDPDWKPPENLGCGSSTFFQQLSGASPGQAKPAEALPSKSVSLSMSQSTVSSEHAKAVSNGYVGSSKKSSEVLSLHVGVDGCGMGAAMWERILSEHCIGDDGRAQGELMGDPSSMFFETKKGRFVPRAVLASNETTLLGGSNCLQYFSPDALISSTGSDADSSWMYYMSSETEKQVVEQTIEALRQQAEMCDSGKCLFMTHSMLDDFGGGFTCNVLQKVKDFGFKILWDVGLVVSPAELEGSIPLGCPNESRALYNTLFSWQYLHEEASVVTIVDNDAMGNIAQKRLGRAPSLTDCYRQVGDVMSAVSSSVRIAPTVTASEGTQHMLPTQVLTNMLPYPRINIVVPSLTPRFSKKMLDFSEEDALDSNMEGINDGLLASVDIKPGNEEKKNTIMAAALYFRNYPIYAPAEVVSMYRALNEYSFTDWGGFACSCHRDATLKDEGEIVGLFNTESIGGLIGKYSKKYDQISNSNDAEAEASRNRLLQFCSEGEFSELVEWMSGLQNDYAEVCIPTRDDDDDGDYDEF